MFIELHGLPNKLWWNHVKPIHEQRAGSALPSSTLSKSWNVRSVTTYRYAGWSPRSFQVFWLYHVQRLATKKGMKLCKNGAPNKNLGVFVSALKLSFNFGLFGGTIIFLTTSRDPRNKSSAPSHAFASPQLWLGYLEQCHVLLYVLDIEQNMWIVSGTLAINVALLTICQTCFLLPFLSCFFTYDFRWLEYEPLKLLSSRDLCPYTLFCHSFWHTTCEYLCPVYFDILSDILSGIYSNWHSFWNLFWYSFGQVCWHLFRHSFWHSMWHLLWHSIWHDIWHLFWQSLWHGHWDPALTVEVPLRSGSEARKCPLKFGARGWDPAMPTEIWRVRECPLRSRSGSARWDLGLAVEVLQCPLRSGVRSWGGRRKEEDGGRRRKEDGGSRRAGWHKI